MHKKNVFYNLLILTLYLIACILIVNQNGQEEKRTTIKEKITTKETKEEI